MEPMPDTPAGGSEDWQNFCRVCEDAAIFRVVQGGYWLCTRCSTRYHPDSSATPVGRIWWRRILRLRR